jgi:hypothetical protein
MLVKFISSTSGQIMMFAPVARQILEILGKDCNARGVITSEQIPEAIDLLRLAAADSRSKASGTTQAPSDDREGENEAPPVGLSQRAHPLIELLDWTLKDDGFILWEAAKDF